MIFGEIIDSRSYYDVYPELMSLLQHQFTDVQSGVQGDAWIWIMQGEEQVALDTFSSMQFQLKSNRIHGELIHTVSTFLSQHVELQLYYEPELEGFEIDL